MSEVFNDKKEWWSKARKDKFDIEIRMSAKEKRQEKCPHTKYVIHCSICGKVLGSEIGLTSAIHTHEIMI